MNIGLRQHMMRPACWSVNVGFLVFQWKNARTTTRECHWEGPPRAGVGQTLGNPVAFPEGRSPSRADGAEVRPCLPDQVTHRGVRSAVGSVTRYGITPSVAYKLVPCRTESI